MKFRHREIGKNVGPLTQDLYNMNQGAAQSFHYSPLSGIKTRSGFKFLNIYSERRSENGFSSLICESDYAQHRPNLSSLEH